mmetsp:Transcript_106318/g.307986  ORF Transcript_106318/g.307986 Transcript_106318/m.307986 type:complete len:392 (+) Transcript_106318:5850-7025(+)
MGATLANIENAPLALKRMTLTHSFVTVPELGGKVVDHYQRETLRQAYLILGASDILGNPVRVLTSLRAGIRDFIGHPVRGLAIYSPYAFMTGAARGTLSLLQASAHSLAYTTARVLLALTRGFQSTGGVVDTNWRGQALRPRGVVDGFGLAVLGLVTEPLRGLRARGSSGLLRGIAAAVLGLGLKPLVGMLTAAGQLVGAVAAALDPLSGQETKLRMKRVRPPRFFRGCGSPLLRYREEENRGEELISRLRRGRHLWESYVHHCKASEGMTLLLTGRRLMLLHTSRKNSFALVEWEVMLHRILRFDIMEGGSLEFVLLPTPAAFSRFSSGMAGPWGRRERSRGRRDEGRLGVVAVLRSIQCEDAEAASLLVEVLTRLVPSLDSSQVSSSKK